MATEENTQVRATKATQPAKRWRNRYLAKQPYYKAAEKKHYDQGDERWGLKMHPSLDVAESEAQRYLSGKLSNGELISVRVEWLGAFPVEPT